MHSQNITTVLVIIGALFLSVVLGTAIPSSQIEVIATVLVVTYIILLFSLKGRVWIIAVIAASASGTISFLPGNFPVWMPVIASCCAMLFFRYMIGIRELKFRFSFVDWMIVAHVLVLLQSLARNPVGLSFFGSDSIGAKSYLVHAGAVVGYFMFGLIKTQSKVFRPLVLIMAGVMCFDGLLAAVSGFLPSVGFFLAHFYNVSAIDYSSIISGSGGNGLSLDRSRFGFLRMFGEAGMLICCSFWRPLSALSPLHPLRMMLLCLSLIAIVLSGFRSRLVSSAGWFVAGSTAWNVRRDIFIAMTISLLMLILVIMTGVSTKLPFSAQRILSAIPGVEVEAAARAQAEGSSEWRFEMWELALSSDRYIKNKLLGDGFGLSAVEHRLAMDEKLGLSGTYQFSGIEYYMAKGSYHGFHVETIRYTGVLGLLIATIILIVFAYKAWKLIIYFRGSKEFGYLLFILIPYLVYPWYFWLIFGSYKNPASGFPIVILMAGLIKMIENIKIDEEKNCASS